MPPTISPATHPEPDACADRDASASLPRGLPRETAALLVMLLVALDAWITTVWLRQGWGYELNPLMRWLAAEGGDALFLLAKLVGTGLCMLWVVHRASRVHARIALCCALAIYGGVVAVHVINSVTLMV